MRIRLLFAMLIAFAMALAPLAMPMGETKAAQPAHHGAIASAEHCPDQPQQPEKADKSCCVAMCVAVVVPSGAAELPAYHGPRQRPAPDRFRRGYLGEIATPPPRFS